jgi:hypothetical protein
MIKVKKRPSRPIVFVCIGSGLTGFTSKVIEAASEQDAALIFLEQENVVASTIYGPFKQKKQIINYKSLKFSDVSKKAIYKDWEVNALYLVEPKDHAYLFFIKRIDGTIQPAPKGTIVVPITELQGI